MMGELITLHLSRFSLISVHEHSPVPKEKKKDEIITSQRKEPFSNGLLQKIISEMDPGENV